MGPEAAPARLDFALETAVEIDLPECEPGEREHMLDDLQGHAE